MDTIILTEKDSDNSDYTLGELLQAKVDEGYTIVTNYDQFLITRSYTLCKLYNKSLDDLLYEAEQLHSKARLAIHSSRDEAEAMCNNYYAFGMHKIINIIKKYNN